MPPKKGLKKRLGTFQHFSRVLGIRQTTWLYLARSLGVRVIDLNIPNVANPVRCRPANSDRRIISQVFIEHDCDPNIGNSPRLIIDGGANIGCVSVFYANKFPDAKIIGIEPDDANFDLAKQNCRFYPNVTLKKAGIWTDNCSLNIVDPNVEADALQVKAADAGSGSIQGVTITRLLEESGFDAIDYLKLDIEGAEEALFSDAGHLEWVDRVKILSVEAHGRKAHETIINAMQNRAFRSKQEGEKIVFYNLSF